MSKFSFVKAILHPNSQHLPINRYVDKLKYIELRKEYNFSGKNKVDLGDGKLYGLNNSRFDFSPHNNVNVGWKVHLNVSLEHVIEVSNFLIRNGFLHKYFWRGELKDGKVFTIYFGSWSKMYEQTEFIEAQIAHLLARPKTINEIEIGQGITARFTVLRNKNTNIWGEETYSDDVYLQYGNFGIIMKKEMLPKLKKNKWKSVFNSKEEEIDYYEQIFNELAQEFGEYFVNLNVVSFR
ncbi:MAG: hypothetical protein ACLFPL_00090 [Candidatus Nanoarchaeia archaeon]